MKSTDVLFKYIEIVISAIFIILFSYAAISKVIDFQRFEVELHKSPLLASFAQMIVWLIPLMEMVVAILLITERYRLIGLYSSFGLMVLFTAYLIAILKFSDYIPCTCGGLLQQMTWKTHIMFNSVFMILATIAVCICRDSRSCIAIHQGKAENPFKK